MYNVIRYIYGKSRLFWRISCDHIVPWAGHGRHLQSGEFEGSTADLPGANLPVAQRKLDQLNAVVTLESLRIPPGNALEALKGTRTGQHSIRINNQFRICFVRMEEGPDRVEITDYHW